MKVCLAGNVGVRCWRWIMINYSSGETDHRNYILQLGLIYGVATRETGNHNHTLRLRSVKYKLSDIRSFIERFKADLRECCRGTTGVCQPGLFCDITVQYIYISDIWLELRLDAQFTCLVFCASAPAATSSAGYFWPSRPRPDFLPGPHSDWRPGWRGSSPGLPTPGTLRVTHC